MFPDSVKKVLSSRSIGDNIFFIEDFTTFSPIKWKGKVADDFVNIREFRFWNRAKRKPLNSGFTVTFEELIVFRVLALKGLDQDKIVKFLQRTSCKSLLSYFLVPPVEKPRKELVDYHGKVNWYRYSKGVTIPLYEELWNIPEKETRNLHRLFLRYSGQKLSL